KEPFSLRPDPEGPSRVLDDGRDPLMDRGDHGEGLGAGVKCREPAQGTNPDLVMVVLQERRDHAVGKRLGVVVIMAEDGKRVSVVAIETFFGSEPEKADVVLDDGLNGALGEPLID